MQIISVTKLITASCTGLFLPSRRDCIYIRVERQWSPTQISEMARLGLLIFAVFDLSQAAGYHRTVSYEGELVAQWYDLCHNKVVWPGIKF